MVTQDDGTRLGLAMLLRAHATAIDRTIQHEHDRMVVDVMRKAATQLEADHKAAVLTLAKRRVAKARLAARKDGAR